MIHTSAQSTNSRSKSRKFLVIGSSILCVGFLIIILKWGTIDRQESERDIAKQAQEYLNQKQPEQLSGELSKLLSDKTKPRVETEKHPLLNVKAPAFKLLNSSDTPYELSQFLAHGPIIVVFYYGYSCDHCVSQLFEFNRDIRYFDELNTTIVAISPDLPEQTRAKYQKYGEFKFPVLSDPSRETAAKYGVYRPKIDKTREWQAHGTFLIDRDGVIRWANTGDEPFTGNITLLGELARLENRTLGSAKSRGGK